MDIAQLVEIVREYAHLLRQALSIARDEKDFLAGGHDQLDGMAAAGARKICGESRRLVTGRRDAQRRLHGPGSTAGRAGNAVRDRDGPALMCEATRVIQRDRCSPSEYQNVARHGVSMSNACCRIDSPMVA
ncbi:hypothetical protein C0Z20_24400 [Trinickia symbiotica]|uniref:Uncharacterized protein n=1 Tax=Trinickia symbiotica TaxID=863227 RepID=A0A2N7WVC5_9BURK|nr:hypothetical protein C0Z20_24400 [Trinickia symbiotica]